jgi:succinoglycan biosynthesis transport protein ExoP
MVTYTQELEESESGLRKFSFLSILRTAWKRKIRIMASWAFLAICAVIAVRFIQPVYQAEAVILIDSQKIPEKFVSATIASDLDERINSIRQLILSGGALKKVIEEFGLYREERKTHFEEEILDTMRKDISITLDMEGPASSDNSRNRSKRPGAFRIGYEGTDPALVTRVANRLADLYVEQNVKTREGQAAGTTDFLDTQLREAKQHLDEMEARVSSYKLQHNGELPQQENTLSGTLARLQTELEANRDAMNRAHQTRVVLESSINAVEASLAAQTSAWELAQHPQEAAEASSGSGQPATAAGMKPSEVLELQLAQLRVRFTDNHPSAIELREQIENLKRIESQKQPANAAATPAAQPTSSAISNRPPATGLREPPEIARTRDQLAGLKAQIKGADTELANREAQQQRILRDLNSYQHRIERLPIREQEMAQITRDYEVSKENYKSLLDKKMAAGMSLDMERRQQSERFIVLDRAQTPEKPIKRQRPKLYAAGVAVGLLLALALAFVAELRQNVFLGEWELPPGTSVLARLPYFEVPIDPGQPKEKSRGWFSRKKKLASATVASLLLTTAAATILQSLADRL